MKDFWQDRNVFVTGCTGILGSWLTMALVEWGANVVGLIYDEDPRSWLWRSGYGGRITRVHGTVTDYELMERVLNEYEIDTCFHLAAQALVTVANRAPLSTFETNIKGTWCVLEAARRSPKLQRIVVASTDKAYGDQEKLPYTEKAPLQGRYPYDVSKSCADLIALAYAHTYNLPVGITRCGNIYGGGDLHWDRVVPGTIRSVLRGQRPIVRSDGTFTRDYLYVQDIVAAYTLLAEQLDRPEVRGQAFNFGLDDPKTVLEVVWAILNVAGRPDLQPVILGEAAHEIRHQYLDSSKARRLLGWEPKWSLEEGLHETLAWYRDFFATDE
ncbi:MAG: GDP-mannose 4,6-dehydratase [Anaerolineae bacterium]|jgi:CDP-glucose 4,6-dehydratase|nr:GDP-mannose 4,6-dehydratase [Anaerolineae bacterium]MDH7474163.1 GDP-mannose 4,6-dehydratase [Anaerolineae bacterium]